MKASTFPSLQEETGAVCSKSEQACWADSGTATILSAQGHKASISKLAWVRQEVIFLGHIFSHKAKKTSDDRIKAILKIPKPIAKKQMMACLA